jgi:hypothetical protein
MLKARVFVPGKPFQPSLLLAVRQEPPRVKKLSDAPPQGRLLVSPTNISLGWESLRGKITVYYYENK